MRETTTYKILFLFVIFIIVVWTLQVGDTFGFDPQSIATINAWIMYIRSAVGV